MDFVKISWVVVLLCVVAACSTDTSEPEVIKKAESYIQNGDYKSAVVTLKSFIKSHPDDFKVRILAGSVYLDSGDYFSAEKEFSRAIENGASEEKLAPKMAKALFYKGDNNEILKLPTQSLNAEDKSEVLTYQGLSLASHHDFKTANAKLNEALQLNEGSDFIVAAMAKVSFLEGYEEKASLLIDRAIAKNPECHYCWSVMGDMAFSKEDYQKSVDFYAKSTSLGRAFSQDYFKRALSLIYLKEDDKAKADLSRLEGIYGKTPESEFGYGLIEYNNGQYREASIIFEKSLVLNGEYVLALFYLAQTQYKLGNYERAEFYDKKVLAVDADNNSANFLMASILSEQGHYSKAIKFLDGRYHKNIQVMGFYSTLLIKSGRTEEAIEILNEMAKVNPESPAIMTQLGRVMLSSGDQGGIEKLKSAIDIDSSYYHADAVLALNYLNNKEYEKSIGVSNKIKEMNPELSLPEGIIGRSYLALDDQKKALEAFSRGCKLTPGDTYTCLIYAATNMKSGNISEAKKSYELFIKEQPDLHQGYLGLAAVYSSEKDYQKFVDTLKEGIKNTDSLLPGLILSRFYLTTNQASNVFPIYQGKESEYSGSSAVYDVLSKAYLQVMNFEAARFNLEKFIEIHSDSAEAWYLMSIAKAGLQDISGYQKALRKSIDLDPDYYLARLALAKKAIYEKQLDEVKKQYEYLAKNQPDSVDTLNVKASIQNMSGDFKGALATYEKLFAEEENFVNMMLVTQQYWNVGDKDSALEGRKTWSENNKGSVPAQMALADVYVSLGDMSKAIEQYKSVLSYDADNFVALNNLAWFLMEDFPEEALKYSERAYQLNSGSIDAMDTMALVLNENGEFYRAKKIMDKVVSRSPDNLTFKYHSALIDANLGNKDSAKRTLATLVDLDFPENREAKDLLNSINQ